jgi:hypothetical protein
MLKLISNYTDNSTMVKNAQKITVLLRIFFLILDLSRSY